MKQLDSAPVRYLAVGLGLFAVDCAVFFSLKFAGLPIAVAQLVSRSVGAGVGFFGHKYFSFRNTDNESVDLAAQGSGYLGVTVLNILLSPVVVVGLDKLLPVPLLVVKVIAEAFMVIETFLLLNLVFRNKPLQEAP